MGTKGNEMVRQVMKKQLRDKLSSVFIKNAKGPAKYGDGKGLWLIVDANGSKRWRFIFSMASKRREMGLGGYPDTSLEKARELRDTARRGIKNGVDPIELRVSEKRKEAVEGKDFGSFADSLVDELAKGFRSDKHIAQWKMTMDVYAAPIRSKSLSKITTEDILSILTPIWHSKPETASRVRGRIERILDAAKGKKLREGENPARWKGNLDAWLSKQDKRLRGHYAAMAFNDVPKFIGKLRSREAVAASALEFLILTAARTNEVLGATWDEFDLDNKIWTISAMRMKAGHTHRVPLTFRAVEILAAMKKLPSISWVFPGLKKGKPLSNMSLAMLVRRMKIENVTVHGFRSSFRDWAGEETHWPREVAEAALAHAIGDATERAYRRGDALEKRRKLMEAWQDYCCYVEGSTNKVIGIKGYKAGAKS
ncbi:MAG: tyrosine-type recombinase/integrase [Kordiimonadaceae bacterium]|nr:tyrosine-type recombinase/integrase [Kordiimonadaceae bacterium]